MNFDISNNLVLLTVHGSRAYGLNDDQSDLDVKGICFVPKKIRHSLFYKFDQAINDLTVNSLPCVMARINPFNPKIESTVYSITKFFQLAAAVNPNIIELLWTDSSDILYESWDAIDLIKNRDLFLSKKAKFTFQGYAFAQAAKIERHRKWLIDPPKCKPTRAEYLLPEKETPEYDVIYKLSQKQIEHWSLSHLSIDTDIRNEIKEETFNLINCVSAVKVGWDNWPSIYTMAAIDKLLAEINLNESFNELIKREHAYQNELKRWNNYLGWKKNRNPERAKIEEKFGFDLKHASHLLRLSRMGIEILEQHKVFVKRPDAEDLKRIRSGAVSYDDVMAEFESLNKKMDELYKTSTLKNNVDFDAIDSLYLSLVE